MSLSKDKALVKKFGANLRRERVAKGISQEKLAELADLNIRTVQRIEAGEITILITTAARIKDGLATNWNTLF